MIAFNPCSTMSRDTVEQGMNAIDVIKGPKSWWITKSITTSRVVNQSKVNPQRPKGVVD